MTRLSIDYSGKVRHSCVVDSSLGSPEGERCVVDEVLRWEFPKPHGEWLIVDYPFVFTPAEEP